MFELRHRDGKNGAGLGPFILIRYAVDDAHKSEKVQALHAVIVVWEASSGDVGQLIVC